MPKKPLEVDTLRSVIHVAQSLEDARLYMSFPSVYKEQAQTYGATIK